MATTTTTTDEQRLARALGFERALHAAAATEIVERPWGCGFFNPALRHCHQQNVCWATGDAGGWEAEALAHDVAELSRERHLRHRAVVVEGAAADARRAWFADAGWEIHHHIYMAHAGQPPAGGPADELPVDEIARLYDRYLATDPDTPYGRNDEIRAHLVEHHRTFGPQGGTRVFAASQDGEPVAWCQLFEADGVAQIEDVVCLLEHRGQGHGRAVVAAATRAALANDPELLFLCADAADWPQLLYSRLGFDPVGHIRIFKRV